MICILDDDPKPSVRFGEVACPSFPWRDWDIPSHLFPLQFAAVCVAYESIFWVWDPMIEAVPVNLRSPLPVIC